MVREFLKLCDTPDAINQALWIAVDHCCPVIVADLLNSGVPIYEFEKLSSFVDSKHEDPKCGKYNYLAVKNEFKQTPGTSVSYCTTVEEDRMPISTPVVLLILIFIVCCSMCSMSILGKRKATGTKVWRPRPPLSKCTYLAQSVCLLIGRKTHLYFSIVRLFRQLALYFLMRV